MNIFLRLIYQYRQVSHCLLPFSETNSTTRSERLEKLSRVSSFVNRVPSVYADDYGAELQSAMSSLTKGKDKCALCRFKMLRPRCKKHCDKERYKVSTLSVHVSLSSCWAANKFYSLCYIAVHTFCTLTVTVILTGSKLCFQFYLWCNVFVPLAFPLASTITWPSDIRAKVGVRRSSTFGESLVGEATRVKADRWPQVLSRHFQSWLLWNRLGTAKTMISSFIQDTFIFRLSYVSDPVVIDIFAQLPCLTEISFGANSESFLRCDPWKCCVIVIINLQLLFMQRWHSKTEAFEIDLPGHPTCWFAVYGNHVESSPTYFEYLSSTWVLQYFQQQRHHGPRTVSQRLQKLIFISSIYSFMTS